MLKCFLSLLVILNLLSKFDFCSREVKKILDNFDSLGVVDSDVIFPLLFKNSPSTLSHIHFCFNLTSFLNNTNFIMQCQYHRVAFRQIAVTTGQSPFSLFCVKLWGKLFNPLYRHLESGGMLTDSMHIESSWVPVLVKLF